MDSVVKELSNVDFLSSKKYQSKASEVKITPETIIERFKNQRSVPPNILQTMTQIADKEIKQEAALKLLRISTYAKSTQGASDLRKWFLTGKVWDIETGSRISVSILDKMANTVVKTSSRLNTIMEKNNKLQNSRKQLTEKQLKSLDSSSAKEEFLDFSMQRDLKKFLDILNRIYLALGSERK